jgi:hypothetical protein
VILDTAEDVSSIVGIITGARGTKGWLAISPLLSLYWMTMLGKILGVTPCRPAFACSGKTMTMRRSRRTTIRAVRVASWMLPFKSLRVSLT